MASFRRKDTCTACGNLPLLVSIQRGIQSLEEWLQLLLDAFEPLPYDRVKMDELFEGIHFYFLIFSIDSVV